jgi:hypothetical protein
MSAYQERYSPVVVPVDSTVPLTGSAVGGFLCKTAGTLTITKNTPSGPVAIVNAVAVTAGVYTPTPFYLGPDGGSVTTGGGASGTLGV